MIKFGSVCSGIEAASVAWHPLGWKAAWLSEIEKFPSQVLAHHYPNTPNFGDMTKFKEWSSDSAINVLVGGTPCQSFSVAGLRKGLDDPRGNLMLTYLAIAAKYRPQWLVWENVPGVLSSNGGLDFASLLRGMGECGYGFAYRVLDAQYFGVAQRRRRVFVVGYLGNWRPAAAVLFERHSLSGHPAPSRKAREEVAGTIAARFGSSRNNHEKCVSWPAEISSFLNASFGKKMGLENQHINAHCPMFVPIKAFYESSLAQYKEADLAGTTKASGGVAGGGSETFITQPIALQDVRAVEKMQNGKGWNDDGTAYTVDTHATQGVAQPIPFDTTQITSKANYSKPQAGDPCHPLAAGAHPPAIAQAMAFPWQSALDPIGNPVNLSGTLVKNQTMAVAMRESGQGYWMEDDIAGTLRAEGEDRPSRPSHVIGIPPAMQVRRLTPMECERLQGFPDGYTDIQLKGKVTPDGPRYKALGNSMAVPVMAWIGKRIQQVEDILG